MPACSSPLFTIYRFTTTTHFREDDIFQFRYNTAEYNHIPSGIYERWERWEQRLSSVFHCPFDILGLLSQSQKHSNSGLICKRTNTYSPVACRTPKYPLSSDILVLKAALFWMNRMLGVLRYCLTTRGGIALRTQVL